MAYRPMAYGLTGEVQRKIKGKYDINLEQEARIWIEDVLQLELKEGADPNQALGQSEFQLCLKDGKILCQLINTLSPGAVKKLNDGKMAFKMMENISNFLTAIEKYGVSRHDLFQTVDLYEGQNMVQVVNAIHALGRKAQKNGFDGPVLGVKEAESNPRNFSDEKMKAGQTVIGLQAGTNKVASQAGMNFGKSRSIID
ncbi:muscle-specific protein 20-like [Mytilus galloprovincialis]|uniref:muscle-specific protein 20-like n=1 Tax=Mytilus edulis TaxID=6550 RepID=UPI0039EF29AD